MFQRVVYEEWQLIFPIIAFATAAGIFGAIVWRAVRMQRSQLERLARMPLEKDAPTSDHHE